MFSMIISSTLADGAPRTPHQCSRGLALSLVQPLLGCAPPQCRVPRPVRPAFHGRASHACGKTLFLVCFNGNAPWQPVPRPGILGNCNVDAVRFRTPDLSVTLPCIPVIAVAFFIVLSATDRIIAGTRFVHLPEGSRHRRSRVSLAMHNPLVCGWQK
jgi:hypothetical protein